MDPDSNLIETRALVREILAARFESERANRLAELVDALDGWLARGGFLPSPWAATLGKTLAAKIADEEAKEERLAHGQFGVGA